MDYLAQQLINGLTLGSIYGLIAIGYTMVYGIIGMINFAHGDVFMVGSFVSLICILLFGITGSTDIMIGIGILMIVAVIAMAISGVYGWTIERLAYRPLRGSFRLAPLITAIGVSIFLQNFVQETQGARVKPLQALFAGGFTLHEGTEFTVRITYMQILIVVLTIVLMTGFSLLISKTSLGRAQRACGIGSLPGAMIGGVLIGLIEVLFAAYFSSEYKDVAAFSMLIIVLIFLPQGLLGRPEIEKV